MTHLLPDSPPTAPRRRNPQETRDRLVRAALELITTNGYHASTTPEIARRAGVAEGTIYRHFQNKQHLLNELYRAAIRLLLKSAAGPATVKCRERLATIAAQWRDLASRDPALIRLVFVADLDGLLDAKSRDARAELRDVLSAIIAAGKAGGEVRAGAAEVWAEAWLAMVALALARVATREWLPAAPPVAQVLDAAWEAIRTRD